MNQMLRHRSAHSSAGSVQSQFFQTTVSKFRLLAVAVVCMTFFGVIMLTVLYAVLQPACLLAQQSVPEESLRIGLYGNVMFNQHLANFRAFPGRDFSGNDSPPYQIGSGVGFAGGLLVEFPLSERIRLSVRGNYATHDGVLRRSEPYPLSDLQGNVINGSREFILTNRLSSAALEPLVSWQPFKRFPAFSVLAGVRAGLLLNARYDQVERIINLQRNSVIDETPTITNDAIPSLQTLQASVVAGFGYEMPIELSTTLPGGSPAALIVTPEITLHYALTPIVQGLTWNAHALRAGIALKYAPAIESSLRTSAMVGTAATKYMSAEVAAIGIDDDGKEVPLVKLRVDEYASKQLHPVLPYIFFESGSAALPLRYTRLFPAETASFNESGLAKAETIEVYYHLLNVVGKRLRDNQAATLRIVGCLGETLAASSPDGNETTLARRRAETIQKYLQEVWGISAERLRIEARTLPRRPTMTRDVLVNAEENRRVELYSDDWSIVKPVLVSDTLRDVSPANLKFSVNVQAQAGVAKWSVKAQQNNTRKPLKQFVGAGTPDASVLWRVARERQSVPTLDRALKYNLEVMDNEERSAETTGSIPVEIVNSQKRRQSGTDKRVDVFRVMNFDPERAEMTTEHVQLIDEFVRPALTKESSLLVTGYTDLLGDVSDNRKLSEDRAQTIARQLLSGNPITSDITARGVGSRVQQYSNATPEGRFYSRIVEIRVETPLK
jgi:outer membrane protein OmpA-like peptidoglycan-associated protein